MQAEIQQQALSLMIQGCSSDAGKSTIVAGLCRLLYRRGFLVAPFKPQNMALNSAVSADGGEIGRAQAVQARACGIEPLIDMNPILLKPNSEMGAQVIIQGKAIAADMDAAIFHNYKQKALGFALESFHRLQQQFPCVVIEGAGSPAEVNLREGDVANMGFAEQIQCPVIIVADIERGGVFASLVGTLAVLSDSDRSLIKGFIINRFRGDLGLLKPGLDWLEAETGLPVLAVLPYLERLQLEAEDSVGAFENELNALAVDKKLKVICPVLPRISNHTDFDVLRAHPQIDFEFVAIGAEIPPADLVILPGSKSVRDDLQVLKDASWLPYLQRHLRYGGKLIGICGGYQMLGRELADPLGIEGLPGKSMGFDLVPIDSVLEADKQLLRRQGRLNLMDETSAISGYEIHCGRSRLLVPSDSQGASLLQFEDSKLADGECDAYISADQQVLGCYLHGLFDEPEALKLIMRWAGVKNSVDFDYASLQETEINRVADALEAQLDLATLAKILAVESL